MPQKNADEGALHFRGKKKTLFNTRLYANAFEESLKMWAREQPTLSEEKRLTIIGRG